MNPKKQYPNDNLQKSSLIFLQLGLILAMLFVYTVLESKFEKKELAGLLAETEDADIIIYPVIPDRIQIERPHKKKKVVADSKPKKNPEKIIIDDNEPKPEPILTPEDSNDDDINQRINELPDSSEDFIDEEPELFINVQSVPRFPGCEELDNVQAVQCFTKKMTRFVNRKFNTGLASDLGLQGRQQIYVQFVIDQNGEVADIVSKAPHVALEKEAQRIIKQLPKMTPGKQRNRAVAVKYTLPIRFIVD